MADQRFFPEEPGPLGPAPAAPARPGVPAPTFFPPADRSDPLVEAMGQATGADEAARLLELRITTGLSPALITRHRAEIERTLAQEGFDAEAFRRTSPRLAEWLAEDRLRAGAAQDDLAALQRLEQTLTFGASILRGVDQVQGLLGGFLEAVGEAELDVPDALRRPGDRGSRAPALAAYGRQVREYNRAQAEALGQRSSIFALRGPWDLAQWAKETIGEQIPIMAPMVAGGAAGAAIGSVVPGVGTTIGAAVGAFLPALVLGVGEVQGTVKELDPTASAPAAAFIGGSAIAALDTVLPGRIGGRLVTTFGRETAEQVARRALQAPVRPAWLRSTVGGTVSGMATEGLTEAVQEAVGALAGAAGTGTGIPDDLWRQMAEAGAAGALIGGGLGGVTEAATVRRRQATVAAAQQQAAFFDALATGVADSKLVARLPQAAAEFLQRATANGPLASVYAPVDTFAEYWQSKGVNPDLMAEELTGRRGALEAARAAGEDLVIPTATYATQVAATEHHAFFAQELRLAPEQLNTREVQALEAAAAAVADTTPETTGKESGRDQVHAQVLEQAIAAGARPEVAEAWATLQADRFATRAARLGLDPAELFTLRPPAAITSDLAPEVSGVSGGSGVSDIPPSPASPRETGAQRATRRTAHLAALSARVVRDAQAVDPTVDAAALRRELEARVSLEEERQQAQRESGGGQDLLRAMAEYGGLWWERRTGGFKGEIEHYALEGRDRREVRDRGTATTWNGVAGVFREEGLTPDGMVEALRQDPRFAYLGDINDLFDAIDQAMRAEADVDVLPGSADLAALGIRPGTRWWSDRWQATEDVDETATEGDDSFEFQQQLLTAAAAADVPVFEATLAQLQALATARVQPGTGTAVRPPFPVLEDAATLGARLLTAAGGVAAIPRAVPQTVPLAQVVALQDWLFPATAAEYAEGTRLPSRPIVALHLHGRYFLADGHHRASAAWVNGATTLDVVVLEVDPTQIDDAGFEFYQRTRAKAKAARAAARTARVTESAAFRAWFGASQVVDAQGDPLVVYHGTSRPDRFGPVIKKARATSGPMPFFTGDPAIASRYAEQKQDTSLANEDVHTYAQWFRMRVGRGTPASIDRAWWFLTPEQRQRIAALAPRVMTTDAGEIVLGPEGHDDGTGGYDQHIIEARGNHFAALVEEWLNSGNLFDDERAFLRVLELAGAPVDEITFHDPNAVFPGVVPVYLSVQRPLDTSTMGDDVVARLEARAKRIRRKPAVAGADFWDKTLRDPREWVAQLQADRAEGINSFVWSSIPDWVTEELQALGYDGIRDAGGKMGGEAHVVWIPFAPGQVKSAIGNRGTFDPASANMLYQREQQRLLDFSSVPFEELPARVQTTRDFQDILAYGASIAREGETAQAALARVGLPSTREAFAHWIYPQRVVGDEQDTDTPRQRAGRASGRGRSRITPGGEFHQLEGFYSRIQRAVEASTQAKASGAQWKAMITNAGVNLEEFEALALAALDGRTVYTREALLDVIAAHQVDVVPVILGDAGVSADAIRARAEELYDAAILQAEEQALLRDRGPAEVSLHQVTIAPEDADDPDSAWVATLDGEEIARGDDEAAAETAADVEIDRINDNIREDWSTDIRNEVSWQDAERQATEELEHTDPTRARFGDYVEPNADPGSYREVFLTAPAARGQHARATLELSPEDRAFLVDFGGGEAQRLTTVENLIQKGELQVARQVVTQAAVHANEQLQEWEGLLPADAFTARAAFARRRTIWVKLDANLTWRTELETTGGWKDGHSEYSHVTNPIVRLRLNTRTLPDGRTALFLEEVQTPRPEEFAKAPALFQQHWRELAFKWALRHAAVNQLDVLAWTNGDMQARRYSLEKQVQSIEWQPRLAGQPLVKDGVAAVRVVQVHTVDSYPPVQLGIGADGAVLTSNRDELEGKALKDVIGKEVADRILADDVGTLSGEGLRIGGTGLKKLYDVDFPAIVKKLPAVKKGGGRVGRVAIGPATRTVDAVERDMDANLAVLMRSTDPAEIARLEAQQRGLQAERTAAQDNGGAVPAIDLTPALREQLLAGQALYQDGGDIKGGYNPATNTLRLVAGRADLSTFLHESGHQFLEELMHDAGLIDQDALAAIQTPDAMTPAQAQQLQLLTDVDAVLRWVGFQGTRAEWLALSVDARREHHEQFARGFEAYLMAGKAPSAELRSAFARFRTWLVAIYRTLRALRVEVTPEIAGVMDRLLATDDAIANAEAEAQVVPLFTDAASAGVDVHTFAAYRHTVEQAHQAAVEDVDRALLQEWRREREAWWQAEREQVRAVVVAELQREPRYVAQSVIRTGKMPDGSIPPFGDGRPLKLSKADLVAVYGPALLKRLPRPYLYAVEGGLPADTIAELTGFGSGDALVQALLVTPPLSRIIDGETDQRMRETHGDLLLEGMSLREQAAGAVHEHRAAVISAELRALTQGMAQAALPPADALNAAAAARIRGTRVRDLKPGLFLQAARRASTQAFEAFGRNDRAGAVRAKQQELTALALYREAREAKARAETTRREVSRYDTHPPTRARLRRAGQDYVDQVDAILERYEFRRVTGTQLDRRESLRKFVAKLEKQGLPIEIPEEVLDDTRRVNWQELTVDELDGVQEAVRSIAHLARLKGKLLKAARDREFAVVTSELATSIRDHGKKRVHGQETRLPSQAAGKFLDGVFAAHRKIASLARGLDGFADGGAMWEYVIRPLNEAADREAQMNADATRALHALFDRYTAAERARWFRLEHVPALGAAEDKGAQLSKAGRLMVALNWGNETNRQRLRDGRGWTDAQVQAVLDTLDRRDWEFVQATWDFIDGYWLDIKAKQERVVGVAPAKVDRVPVFTRFGEFGGGYFPIKFEGELAPGPAAHQEAELASLQQLAAYATATTRRGHTKERAEGEVQLPVRLDFGVIFEHVGQVIHDLTHHEALIDVGRVLRDEAVAAAIYDVAGEKVYRQFKNTLRDVALGDQPARDDVERFVNHIRTGSTVVGLGWSITTSLLQPFGLTQSMVRIGPRWVARGIASWFGSPQRMAAKVAEVQAKSAFMLNRGRTMQRELNEIRNQVGLDTGRLAGWVDAALRGVPGNPATKQAIADSYFTLIQRMQLMADMPTWLGAYEQALADPANVTDDGLVDEPRAIALADQAVLDSQGGGQIKDLASVQRGSAYLKLFTNFYSFFNTTYNLSVEATRTARRDRSPAAVGRLAVDYLLLFTVPAALSSLLRDALAGEDDPEELATNAIVATGAYLLGTMIVVRELGGAVQGYFGYEGPAGLRSIGSVSRVIRDARDGSLSASGTRAAIDAVGTLFHLPVGQVRRTLEGILALMEGRTSNPGALVVGPPRE